MKKTTITLLALGAAAALALTACSNSSSGGSTTTTTQPPATSTSSSAPVSTSTSSSAAADSITPSTGFPAGSTIGVSLPQKTSENWVLAEGLFNDGLKAAGYNPMVTFADGGVTEQQNQIQSMITAGAKVIVIGAIDGSQ
ncbi:MAG: substrate-binding domain-containing protein, partial [Actinomycetia bacterium]|nr:substrate-binding domain-containing protein [Actinomycetes bacterium]